MCFVDEIILQQFKSKGPLKNPPQLEIKPSPFRCMMLCGSALFVTIDRSTQDAEFHRKFVAGLGIASLVSRMLHLGVLVKNRGIFFRGTVLRLFIFFYLTDLLGGDYQIVRGFGLIEGFVNGELGSTVGYHEKVLFIHYSSIF